ncbi:MAG: SCO family protein [Kiloniellales bacterium]|nr:SCO family protein [Kiloniellales bacterium]
MHKRAIIIFLVGLLVLLGGAAAYIGSKQFYTEADLPSRAVGSTPEIGGAFELLDQSGVTRTQADFAGRHMLVYFGYTYCPDVCPTSLSIMSQALDLLEAETGSLEDRVVPVFVTVDPARDDVPAMAAYAEHFHPRLVALTGSDQQIAAAAKAYRVYYRKAEDPSASEYLMDHSSFIYLMGPDGTYVGHFAHNASPQEIAEGLKRFLDL